MIFPPAKLEAGEEYASVDDILLASDLPEMVIRVPQWKKAIRIRALSLEQKERILLEARRDDGTLDGIKQAEATIREGCLMPRFDQNTAERLRHKNPDAIRNVFDTIWSLSALNQDIIDAVINEQTGAKLVEPQPDPGA